MKNCIIAMCANENLYLREWVEHYKKLGFDNIILCDNNMTDGERPEEVIQDYVEEGFVILENKRGIRKFRYQFLLYSEMYLKYKKNYDWLGFFDIDEFLILKKDKNIQEYLSRKCFNNIDVITINWKIFDDNGLLRYENKPLMERFTHEAPDDVKTHIGQKCNANDIFKSIIKGGLKCIQFTFSPHSPNGFHLSVSDSEGNIFNNTNYCYHESKQELAQLNHYIFKTIEEYSVLKRKRGYPNNSIDFVQKKLGYERFCMVNENTKEKKQIFLENCEPICSET